MLDIHPNIISRTQRTLIPCPVCNRPIGERLGNQWWFLKYENNKKIYTKHETFKNSPTGGYKVHCPDENCPGAHNFLWVDENIRIS